MMIATLHIQTGKFQLFLLMSKTGNQDRKKRREIEYSKKMYGDQMWFCTDSDKHVCFEKYCRVWLFLSVQFTYLSLGSMQGTGNGTELSAAFLKSDAFVSLCSQPTSLITLIQIKNLIQIQTLISLWEF